MSDAQRTRPQTPSRILFAAAGLVMTGVLVVGLGLKGLVLAPVVLIASYVLAGSLVGSGITMLIAAVAGLAVLGMWAFVPPELVGYATAGQLVLPAVLVLALTQVSPVVRRFRTERRGGRTVDVAADVATSTAGRPALVAGAAMTASLTGLALGAEGELSTLATAALLATIATLVVVTLLQPVLLTRLGGLDRVLASRSSRRVTHLRATVVVTGVALRRPVTTLTLTAVTVLAVLAGAVRLMPLGPVTGALMLAAGPLTVQLVVLLDRITAATRAGMTRRNAIAGGTRDAAGPIAASAAVTAGLLALLVPGATGWAAAVLVLIASMVAVLAVPSLLLLVRTSGSVAGQRGVSHPEHHGC
ncbi:MAG: hypothetical protein JWQ81_7425 [Amycolatopsis sp.]|uniref:hypothetical protein n=1 Tax=Amycolatopsis sp. TaxID=37632 RepID=UPI00262E546E|nr:hypothetical protein [Amycolatopsis sp.]MCU1686686.1 hypothetical protein [Amycolatopsis sp.]